MSYSFEIEDLDTSGYMPVKKNSLRITSGSLAVGPSEGDSRFRESIDLGRVYIRMSEMAELRAQVVGDHK